MKRKLKDAFGDATDLATRRAGKKAAARPEAITILQSFLDRVGRACGYCFALRISNPQAHSPDHCPSMKKVIGQFWTLKKAITYENGGACYHCHIASFGGDILHPPFQSGSKGATCPNPYLVLPLAFAMYHDSELKKDALTHFKPQDGEWGNPQGFAHWFVSKHPRFRLNSMAILDYFATSR